MKKRTLLIATVLVSFAMLTACGGGGGGSAPPPPPNPNPTLGTLITNPTVSPITAFAQTVPLTGNELADIFPGQANYWDISRDFVLEDGGDDQFEGAMILSVSTGGTTTTVFPLNPGQDYGELTFYGPTMNAADGLTTAVVSDGSSLDLLGLTSAISGTYSAFLNATSDSRLQQTLVLSAATGTITASWTHDYSLCDNYSGGSLNGIGGYTPSYRVVVRDTGGTELGVLYEKNTPGGAVDSPIADLTAYAGQTVVLSFEEKSSQADGYLCYTELDDVSVRDNDGAGSEFVMNGGFETGNLTGWTTNAATATEVQNMTSGVRTLEGLDVTRSFYTVPNKLWGRWVDVFSNPTGSDIVRTVTYTTELGSHIYSNPTISAFGVIYPSVGANNEAITSWDGGTGDRDVGWVFGQGATPDYKSSTDLNVGDGSAMIYVTYNITVPAGGKVALVNFIIMDGTDTGNYGFNTNLASKATEIDTEAAKIANNFWTDGQYRTGMTQAQIDAITNF